MASVRKEDIPDIAQFMPEFWEIIKRYWIVEDTDEWWEEVIQTCDQCFKKYNKDLFVRRMLGAFTNYLEEKRNEERRKAG